jgi:hypothetical protein
MLIGKFAQVFEIHRRVCTLFISSYEECAHFFLDHHLAQVCTHSKRSYQRSPHLTKGHVSTACLSPRSCRLQNRLRRIEIWIVHTRLVSLYVLLALKFSQKTSIKTFLSDAGVLSRCTHSVHNIDINQALENDWAWFVEQLQALIANSCVFFVAKILRNMRL